MFWLVLEPQEAIISHLSWYTLFLGFHNLGLYVHKTLDRGRGLRTPEKQILLEAGLASVRSSLQWQVATYGMDSFCRMPTAIASTAWPNYGDLSGLPGWIVEAINSGTKRCVSCRSALVTSLSPRHRPWTAHTTTLISWSRVHSTPGGSKLMPQGKDFGYSFPLRRSPGRGGTCDISAPRDALYLPDRFLGPLIRRLVTFYGT